MDVDEVGQSIELEMEIDEEESIVMELDADMPEVGTDVGRLTRYESQTQFMEIEPEPGVGILTKCQPQTQMIGGSSVVEPGSLAVWDRVDRQKMRWNWRRLSKKLSQGQ